MALTPDEIAQVFAEANHQLFTRGTTNYRIEHPLIPNGYHEADVNTFLPPADVTTILDVIAKLEAYMNTVLSEPDPGLIERAKRAFRAYFERILPPGSILPDWDDAPVYIQAAWLAAAEAAAQPVP